jgi:molybdopterin-synthase adenylyltransferase
MIPVEEKLQKFATKKHRPDGSDYLALSHADESTLAAESGNSRKDIQILALRNGISPQRYCRNQQYLSLEDQVHLLESHVAVIGLGGLGGTVTEILCRVGIGTLTLVDGDNFDESNLNRQLLSSVENLGEKKAEVAANRVRQINPAVATFPVVEFLSESNSTDILQNTCAAVDCLDNIKDRFILEDACKVLSIPFISGAIGGTAGQVTTITPDSVGLEMVYGSRGKSRKRGIEAQLGTMVYSAVSIAALQCSEIVALATGKKPQLVNRMLLADYTFPSMDIVDFV